MYQEKKSKLTSLIKVLVILTADMGNLMESSSIFIAWGNRTTSCLSYQPMKEDGVPIKNKVKGDIPLKQTVPVQTTCGGLLCDKQRPQDCVGSNKGCRCYHVTQSRSSLTFEHSFYFKTQNGQVKERFFFNKIQFTLFIKFFTFTHKNQCTTNVWSILGHWRTKLFNAWVIMMVGL